MYIVFYNRNTGNVSHKQFTSTKEAQRALLENGFIMDNNIGVWHNPKWFAKIRNTLPQCWKVDK